MDVTVDSFTVSYSFDVHEAGLKHSSFMSMTFRTSRPVEAADVEALQISHSATVTSAAYYDALARGVISTEDANALISESRERHRMIADKLRSRT